VGARLRAGLTEDYRSGFEKTIYFHKLENQPAKS
jgi:hypothetical protein